MDKNIQKRNCKMKWHKKITMRQGTANSESSRS